jgi:hypothetical protein
MIYLLLEEHDRDLVRSGNALRSPDPKDSSGLS